MKPLTKKQLKFWLKERWRMTFMLAIVVLNAIFFEWFVKFFERHLPMMEMFYAVWSLLITLLGLMLCFIMLFYQSKYLLNYKEVNKYDR